LISVVSAAGQQWVGAWTPWERAVSPPEGAAFLLPAGAKLTAELHYRGREIDLEDRSSIALFFTADDAPLAGEIVIEVANGAGPRARGASTVREDALVWAISPQVHAPAGPTSNGGLHGDSTATTGSLEVTAHKPDGSVEVLLWIPQYRPDWPIPYLLERPAHLPSGSVVSVIATGIASQHGTGASVRTVVTLSTYR
jgi:hypothetical protein